MAKNEATKKMTAILNYVGKVAFVDQSGFAPNDIDMKKVIQKHGQLLKAANQSPWVAIIAKNNDRLLQQQRQGADARDVISLLFESVSPQEVPVLLYNKTKEAYANAIELGALEYKIGNLVET